jgi:hypothetical protein
LPFVTNSILTFATQQDRKQRAIAVEERKLSKALKQREAEFNNELKKKDSQIKVWSFISTLKRWKNCGAS